MVCAALALVVALCASPASAQLNDQLKAYTGVNAEGYLQPLSSAFGAALNDAFFYSADIPTSGIRITLEFPIMGVIFSDDDRTFSAVPEGSFTPSSAVEAPTIVGSGEAKVITNSGGGSYAFPGGFDLNSFGLVVPQLRIGGIRGTEALIRWFAIDPDTDSELGNISLYGFGLRHSISQYLSEDFPLDLAGGFMWQSFTVGENAGGDDLISSDALSFGVQGSKTLGAGFISIIPFAGLSFDTFSMDVQYTSEVEGEELIDLSFDSENTVHLTLGAGIQLPVAHVHGAFNIASQSSFNFGIALGNVGF
jgi:hypothetical protein